MSLLYANDFTEIPAALAGNQPLRDAMLALIANQPIAGKATEGDNRLNTFREILHELTTGTINIHQAIRRVESELPADSSAYAGNNQVFPHGWAERLVRTQFSRFYNQAVLEELIARGETECFVPHSPSEQGTAPCSQVLAGRTHSVRLLHTLLVDSYGLGHWSDIPKVPDHPHCTHVVAPKGQNAP